MAGPKLVRLRNRFTGVVVQTSEGNATRLADYESAQSKTTSSSSSKSTGSTSSSKSSSK